MARLLIETATGIKEPYIVYDLRVVYPFIDIELLPGPPKIGGVIQSAVYNMKYYSEPDEIKRDKMLRPINILKRSQFFETFGDSEGNIHETEHISVKNSAYLAGQVDLWLAPEIGVQGTQTINLPVVSKYRVGYFFTNVVLFSDMTNFYTGNVSFQSLMIALYDTSILTTNILDKVEYYIMTSQISVSGFVTGGVLQNIYLSMGGTSSTGSLEEIYKLCFDSDHQIKIFNQAPYNPIPYEFTIKIKDIPDKMNNIIFVERSLSSGSFFRKIIFRINDGRNKFLFTIVQYENNFYLIFYVNLPSLIEIEAPKNEYYSDSPPYLIEESPHKKLFKILKENSGFNASYLYGASSANLTYSLNILHTTTNRCAFFVGVFAFPKNINDDFFVLNSETMKNFPSSVSPEPKNFPLTSFGISYSIFSSNHNIFIDYYSMFLSVAEILNQASYPYSRFAFSCNENNFQHTYSPASFSGYSRSFLAINAWRFYIPGISDVCYTSSNPIDYFFIYPNFINIAGNTPDEKHEVNRFYFNFQIHPKKPSSLGNLSIGTQFVSYIFRTKLVNRQITINTYNFNALSFSRALERLDMVDILIDNGYTSTQEGFNAYSLPLVSWAENSEGEKVPAIAAVNTPVNTRMTFSHLIPNTNYAFLTANYFKYEGLGYSVLLPATSLYAVLVTGQFRNFDEFAPVYQKLLVPVGPVDKVYSATEREILLTKRVNSLATYNGYWVFNNNFTTNSTTIFKEENIRRLANAVARNLKIVLKQFVGRINNKKTREEVVEKVKQMLARTIDINRYKPDDYIITCDESNNTDNHNYLYVDIAIKMPMSIKYIHLTTVAMPI